MGNREQQPGIPQAHAGQELVGFYDPTTGQYYSADQAPQQPTNAVLAPYAPPAAYPGVQMYPYGVQPQQPGVDPYQQGYVAGAQAMMQYASQRLHTPNSLEGAQRSFSQEPEHLPLPERPSRGEHRRLPSRLVALAAGMAIGLYGMSSLGVGGDESNVQKTVRVATGTFDFYKGIID